jgi:hypothetical protein
MVPATVTLRQGALTATTATIRMPAHLTATMVPIGSPEASLSELDPGSVAASANVGTSGPAFAVVVRPSWAAAVLDHEDS